MKKNLIAFVDSLPSVFTDLFGYPTIRVYSDYLELYFDTCNTIRDVSVFGSIESDEFRIFSDGDRLTVVYTFYFGR